MGFVLFSLLFFLVSGEDHLSKGIFSGRLIRVNREISLARFKMDFSNFRYLNKKNRLEFWSSHAKTKTCFGHILGKSDQVMLVKVYQFHNCAKFVNFSAGAYFYFYSQDLSSNLKTGRELVKILNKKRLALSGRVRREQKKLAVYMDKISVVNDRFRILREKLEAQWHDEIKDIEEDQVATLKKYKDLQVQLNEIDFKLQRYRIEDENLTLDRWSLDPRLYYKK